MRINLLQQQMTTLQSKDTNNGVLLSEYMPLIEQLCLYLKNRHSFYTQEDNFAIYK